MGDRSLGSVTEPTPYTDRPRLPCQVRETATAFRVLGTSPCDSVEEMQSSSPDPASQCKNPCVLFWNILVLIRSKQILTLIKATWCSYSISLQCLIDGSVVMKAWIRGTRACPPFPGQLAWAGCNGGIDEFSSTGLWVAGNLALRKKGGVPCLEVWPFILVSLYPCFF